MDQKQWLEWRRSGVGASDVAASYAGSYGGIYAISAEKLGIPRKSAIDPETANRGNRWEQPISDAVNAMTPLTVVGTQLAVNADINPRYLATLDGLLSSEARTTVDEALAVVEFKTRNKFVPFPWDYVRAQTQWQMMVANKPMALVAVATIELDPILGLEMARDVHLEWVEANPEMQFQLTRIADRILEVMDSRKLPRVDQFTVVDDVREANAKADPEAPSVDLADLEERCRDYTAAKAAIRRNKATADECAAAIRSTMGEATAGHLPDGSTVRIGEPISKFTRDSESRALEYYPEYGHLKLDRKRFEEEEPILYELLKAPSSDRRLTIKPPKRKGKR